MKAFVDNFAEGDVVHGTFLVVAKSMRTSRDGEPYLRLTLSDRTGTVTARAWTDPQMLAARVDVDDFVALRAEVVAFNDELQLEVSDLDRVADAEVDLGDFFATSRWDRAEMYAQLRALLDREVESAPLRAFLDALFADDERVARFQTAPAAMGNHHAYLGGLLEHCLSMCRIALRLAEHYDLYYPHLINRDLLLTGVILHDFAKVWELSYRRTFDYTTAGRLVGHIPMGAELVTKVAARAARPISEDLQLHLKHLVLSHHGELAFGSPVKPATAEAVLLHEIDMIDSRMNMFASEFDALHDENAAETWSQYRRNLGARILFRGRNSSDWQLDSSTRPEDLAGPGLAKSSARSGATNLDLFDDET